MPKTMSSKSPMYDPNECYTLTKKLEKDKEVRPADVFQGYKAPKKKCPKGHKVCKCGKKKKGQKVGASKPVPKGFHRMPDGSIMRDDDPSMKNKKKKKSKY